MYYHNDDIVYAQWQMARHKALCKGKQPPTLLEFKRTFNTEPERDGLWKMMRNENDRIASKYRFDKYDWKSRTVIV
jgi:hypothetical protein